MLKSRYDEQTCSVARTLEIVGERWTLLIVRDLFLGLRRFDQFQDHLGVARNVLSARLDKLVEAGIVERVPYSERPVRHEYHLTEKGIDMWPTIVAMLHWGDKYAPVPGGPPIVLRHRECGGEVDSHRFCSECGAKLGARDVWAFAGPGAAPNHPLVKQQAAREAAASAA